MANLTAVEVRDYLHACPGLQVAGICDELLTAVYREIVGDNSATPAADELEALPRGIPLCLRC